MQVNMEVLNARLDNAVKFFLQAPTGQYDDEAVLCIAAVHKLLQTVLISLSKEA